MHSYTAHARNRDVHVEIVGKRARLETAEHGIPKLLPPRRIGRGGREMRIDVARFDGRCLRTVIIGPDGAGGEHGEQRRTREDPRRSCSVPETPALMLGRRQILVIHDVGGCQKSDLVHGCVSLV